MSEIVLRGHQSVKDGLIFSLFPGSKSRSDVNL